MEDEEQESQMSKEEILAQSRKENKNGDEREKQYLYKGAYLATGVGFLLYGIISIVLAIFDRQSFEMSIVTFAILGTMYLVFGIKTAKHKPLFLATGVVCLTASVVNLIGWILQLCGVL